MNDPVYSAALIVCGLALAYIALRYAIFPVVGGLLIDLAKHIQLRRSDAKRVRREFPQWF